MFKTIFQIFKISGVKTTHFIFLFFGTLIISFIEVLSISSIYPIVSSLVVGEIPEKLNFISKLFPDYNLVFITFSIFCVLFIFKNFCILLFLWFSGKFVFKLQENLMNRIYKTYLSKDLKEIFNINKATIIRNISFGRDLTKSLDLIIKVFIEIFTALILILLIFFVIEIKAFFVLIVLLVSILIAFGFLREKLKIWGKRASRLQAAVLKNMNETFEGIKEIKIFNKEKFFLKIFQLNNFQSFRIQLLKNVSDQLPKVIVETSAIVLFSLLVFYIVFIKNENFSNEMLPLLGMLGLIILRLIPAFSKILYSFNQINFLKYQIQVLSDINWDHFQTIKNSKNNPDEEIKYNFKNFSNINLKKVTFSYGNTEIFNNLDFNIKKNEFIGIMGSSGSGKTTLVKLILGLISPNQGQIILDDKEIKKLYKEMKISYVFQDTFLIDDSIKNNVCLGESENNINIEKFKKCIHDAELNELINMKPEKENFKIGENGNFISQGQKQRIAIARALYFSPEILVLDEPTSSLDYTTEKKIVECINKLKGSKTIFFISHNKENLSHCDKVISIEKDKVNIL